MVVEMGRELRIIAEGVCANCGEPIKLALYGDGTEQWFHGSGGWEFCRKQVASPVAAGADPKPQDEQSNVEGLRAALLRLSDTLDPDEGPVILAWSVDRLAERLAEELTAERAVAVPPTAERPEDEQRVCGYNVGDAYPCRCLLPDGHRGRHQCEHVIAAAALPEDGNRPDEHDHDPLDIVFAATNQPRVVAHYPCGDETAFAVGASRTARQAADDHRETYLALAGPSDTATTPARGFAEPERITGDPYREMSILDGPDFPATPEGERP